MKLLVVTQKIDANDDDLGFFIDWLTKLAQHADLLVVANYVGFHSLPQDFEIPLAEVRQSSRSVTLGLGASAACHTV